MGTIASQITHLTTVYSTVYSGTNQRKYQISGSLAFVRGIHRWAVNSSHKVSVRRKMLPNIMVKTFPLKKTLLVLVCGVVVVIQLQTNTTCWHPYTNRQKISTDVALVFTFCNKVTLSYSYCDSNLSNANRIYIFVRSRRCVCLVAWYCMRWQQNQVTRQPLLLDLTHIHKIYLGNMGVSIRPGNSQCWFGNRWGASYMAKHFIFRLQSENNVSVCQGSQLFDLAEIGDFYQWHDLPYWYLGPFYPYRRWGRTSSFCLANIIFVESIFWTHLQRMIRFHRFLKSYPNTATNAEWTNATLKPRIVMTSQLLQVAVTRSHIIKSLIVPAPQ